jgi:hypothetical protein
VPFAGTLDPDAWVVFGGQFELRRGDGNTKDPPRPMLIGPTAGSQVGTCFVPVTAKSCQTGQQREFPTHCAIGGKCVLAE